MSFRVVFVIVGYSYYYDLLLQIFKIANYTLNYYKVL